MTLLVEFTLDDSWDAYIPDDDEKLSALVNTVALEGVETRIVTDEQIKKVPEMIEALKRQFNGNIVVIQYSRDAKLIENAIKLNQEIETLLKELES